MTGPLAGSAVVRPQRACPMNAIILLGTLKTDGLSNTATLSEFLAERLDKSEVATDIVRLVDLKLLPGTETDMGENDEWPALLERILAADMVIFATPIWWDGHSSLIQRVIERLDALHDEIMAGKPSRLDGKVAGIVITGGSDGAQHILGHLMNFCNAVGLLVPPYATLSVLWQRHQKDKHPSRADLIAKYDSDYRKATDKMVEQLIRYARQA